MYAELIQTVMTLCVTEKVMILLRPGHITLNQHPLNVLRHVGSWETPSEVDQYYIPMGQKIFVDFATMYEGIIKKVRMKSGIFIRIFS